MATKIAIGIALLFILLFAMHALSSLVDLIHGEMSGRRKLRELKRKHCKGCWHEHESLDRCRDLHCSVYKNHFKQKE